MAEYENRVRSLGRADVAIDAGLRAYMLRVYNYMLMGLALMNTERYAKLVASMGKETQFLFISHNKIAMEMAEQLIGVTMQEQGVSRIVAVDMESAVGMAEA